MAITPTWDNWDKTALLIEFSGDWSWSDYDAAMDKAYTMIAEVDHRADIILDTVKSSEFPTVRSLRHFQRSQEHKPANVGTLVAVCIDAFASGVCAMFLKAQLATSIDEAHIILANRQKYSGPEATGKLLPAH